MTIYRCNHCELVYDLCNWTDGKDMVDPICTGARRTYKPVCCVCGKIVQELGPLATGLLGKSAVHVPRSAPRDGRGL